MHTTNFILGEALNSTAYWIQLPNEFKGKNFKVHLSILDSMELSSYQHSIQRFVCRVHPSFSIDYINARIPIMAYKMSSLAEDNTPIVDSIQGTLMVIY